MQQEYFISTKHTNQNAPSSEIVSSTKSAFEVLKSNQQTYKKQLLKSSKKVARKVKKHHHFATQAFIVLTIAVFVVASNINPNQATPNYGSGFGGLVASTTIDEVATAQVAKQIAQGANLLIVDNVSNLADSLEARVEFSASTESYLSKPQIVATNAVTRQDVIEYKTKKGDTISKLARKFGVTSDTIRWANDLTGDLLAPNKTLLIPPVTGLIYTVKSGDTPTSLAKRYNANADQIVSFNDAEINGLKVGSRIVIPDGRELVVQQTPTYFSNSGSGGGASFATITPIYGGNGYSYGYCTWHAANRRAAIGKPLPRNLGNANTWASLAAAAGLTVSTVPKAGAVLWHQNPWNIAGGYGHVAFVESINAKGEAVVSDMNYSAGWNAVSYRTIPKSEFSKYLFIY